jgi:hypothetical protein
MDCQHLKSDLLDKSMKFNEKERARDGNAIIAELDFIEVDGRIIAKCRHGDKSQQWFINEDFTTAKVVDDKKDLSDFIRNQVSKHRICAICLDDIERDKYDEHMQKDHRYETINITQK